VVSAAEEWREAAVESPRAYCLTIREHGGSTGSGVLSCSWIWRCI